MNNVIADEWIGLEGGQKNWGSFNFSVITTFLAVPYYYYLLYIMPGLTLPVLVLYSLSSYSPQKPFHVIHPFPQRANK